MIDQKIISCFIHHSLGSRFAYQN